MSFAEKIAEKLAQKRADAARRENPELEAKLDQFIRDNPRLHEHLKGLSRDELVHRLMLEKMGRAETIERRDQELAQWVKENPEIVTKVEARIRNVAEDNRQLAAVKMSQVETAKQSIRAPGMRP